jgi:hypothetical protein
MSISALKENTLLIDQIRTAYQRGRQNFKQQSAPTYNLKSSADEEVSSQQKNTFVSERINEQASFIAYNYRLQPGVPLSKLEKPERQYNDQRKKQTIEVEDQETGELLDSELINDENPYNNPIGKGFYINANNFSYGGNKFKSMSELFQEKIYHVYNIGYTREPGTLVNLVF